MWSAEEIKEESEDEAPWEPTTNETGDLDPVEFSITIKQEPVTVTDPSLSDACICINNSVEDNNETGSYPNPTDDDVLNGDYGDGGSEELYGGSEFATIIAMADDMAYNDEEHLSFSTISRVTSRRCAAAAGSPSASCTWVDAAPPPPPPQPPPLPLPPPPPPPSPSPPPVRQRMTTRRQRATYSRTSSRRRQDCNERERLRTYATNEKFHNLRLMLPGNGPLTKLNILINSVDLIKLLANTISAILHKKTIYSFSPNEKWARRIGKMIKGVFTSNPSYSSEVIGMNLLALLALQRPAEEHRRRRTRRSLNPDNNNSLG